MTSIARLKDRARKHEQKEDWKAAIEAYRNVLEKEEADDEIELELGLYNRVGDLYLRLGQTDEAVGYYEKAADKYAESGFFNNAIALCNKALRHRPDRPPIYLKLSRFCHEQGFITDARRWILDYAERQVKRGRVDAAIEGLHEFAEISGAPDVRELLAQQLASQERNEDAVEQLRHAHAEWARRGDDAAAERVAERARGLDPDVELDAVAAGPPPSIAGLPGYDDPEPEPGLGIDAPPSEGVDEDMAAAASGLEGLETHRVDTSGAPDEADEADEVAAGPEEAEEAMGGLETFAPPAGDEEELAAGAPPEVDDDGADTPEPLPLLDTPAEAAGEEAIEAEVPGEEAVEEEPVEAAAVEELDLEPSEAVAGEPDAEEVEGLDLAAGLERDAGGMDTGEDAEGVAFEAMDLDLAQFGLGGEATAAAPTGPSPEDRAEVDVDAVLDRAKELVSRGLGGEAVRELRLLSKTDASPDVFRQALSVINEVVRQNPDDVSVLQRRVEFASRTGDRLTMVDSYVDLAEALERTGAEVKAQAMYQRVLGLDPENSAAREALGAAADQDSDHVDLDAILREMSQAAAAAEGGEAGSEMDQSFAAMLSEFKTQVGDKPAGEDAGDHYDLGLAFKEMGLIDEAIGEFQIALTGGEERLKVYEELGQCFMLKGQFNVALKVLKRALKAPRQDESDLLGVYYHMGQCHQELGDRAEARAAYEKVLAIHPEFGDVPDRVGRL